MVRILHKSNFLKKCLEFALNVRIQVSLIGRISSINFLEHKQYLEQQIAYIEQQINSEKKHDFMKDY